MSAQSVTSSNLPSLIRQVIRHASTVEGSYLATVRLESDGRALYAIATDGYTLAVARERFGYDPQAERGPFATVLWARDAVHLADLCTHDPWGDGDHDYGPPERTVSLEAGDGDPVIVTATVTDCGGGMYATDSARVQYLAAPSQSPNGRPPLDWRRQVRECLDARTGQSAVGSVVLDRHLLERWERAGAGPLHFGFTGEHGAIVVTSRDFIGIQVPAKAFAYGPSFAELAGAWGDDLAAVTAERH